MARRIVSTRQPVGAQMQHAVSARIGNDSAIRCSCESDKCFKPLPTHLPRGGRLIGGRSPTQTIALLLDVGWHQHHRSRHGTVERIPTSGFKAMW